jgi:hypothetical protein
MNFSGTNMPLLEITFPPDLQQFIERQEQELKFDTPEDYVISILERALSESSHQNQGVAVQRQWIQDPPPRATI